MKRKSLIILLLIMCFVAVGCGSKSDKTTTETKEEEEKVKSVTYFGDAKTTDKLGFTISYYNDVNTFIGITDDGIADAFEKDNSYLKNDKITIYAYDSDNISIKYDGKDRYIDFDTGYVKYNDEEETTEETNNEEENETTEEDKLDIAPPSNEPSLKVFDSEDVVYQDGNYIITKYSSKYYIYYVAKIEERYSSDYAYAISFDSYYNEEDAKEALDIYKEKFAICAYDDDISDCKDDEGNKVDYKKYKYINDMVVDYLADNNMYVDSYEKIEYFSYGTIRVSDESTLAEGAEILFDIEVHNYSYTGHEEPVGKINGSEIIYDNSAYYVYMKNSERYNSIEIRLPAGVEDNAENVMKSLKDTFKK